ncbi:TlpA family protein disulfide reductase [Pseudonocardia abyssalis]|jgi:thiol-disulfide isomerase/thioredoxin|uniref:TlpA family protein disulfide reductase n=2 Tax=Pseudonocardia abyssalis TaxID=2792008 RepID=A0ABS6URZ1_9PSEU|nr:TlpA disulfide reductase family protein [Pseudonocardia abyssalis]MBW0135025.1 TlpA family protein disulfide reductase [Pseudonocardia abyssalis]
MSQTTTGRSPSPRPSRRRWPLLAGIGLAVIAVLAVAYTALSPAPTPPTGSSTGVEFTATTLSGQQVDVPGGKPSVVYFFTVNCGTCGPEAQALAQLQQTTPAANFAAVDLDPNETVEDIRGFLDTNQATDLAYAIDTDGRLLSGYQISQIGVAVVLDADGTEVFRGYKPDIAQIQTALTEAGTR